VGWGWGGGGVPPVGPPRRHPRRPLALALRQCRWGGPTSTCFPLGALFPPAPPPRPWPRSMGGLLLRFAAGALYDPATGHVAGLRPLHYICMATPHLGCDGDGESQVRQCHGVAGLGRAGARASGHRSGGQTKFRVLKTERQSEASRPHSTPRWAAPASAPATAAARRRPEKSGFTFGMFFRCVFNWGCVLDSGCVFGPRADSPR
jgi:hypothetical protein